MERMEKLALRLRIHRKLEKQLWTDLQTVIVGAYSDGYTVSHIASTLGISRQTVYEHLKRT